MHDAALLPWLLRHKKVGRSRRTSRRGKKKLQRALGQFEVYPRDPLLLVSISAWKNPLNSVLYLLSFLWTSNNNVSGQVPRWTINHYPPRLCAYSISQSPRCLLSKLFLKVDPINRGKIHIEENWPKSTIDNALLPLLLGSFLPHLLGQLLPPFVGSTFYPFLLCHFYPFLLRRNVPINIARFARNVVLWDNFGNFQTPWKSRN